MKKIRWGILISLSAVSLLMCSCRADVPDVIDSLLSDTVTDAVIPEDQPHAEYRKLFNEYKAADAEYFRNTASAINSLIGQKYAYGITAYEHDADLLDVAEMFFDRNSEQTLGIYFTLRGFESKSYSEEGNTAVFTAMKKSDEYVYEMTYDADAGSFEIVLSVNGETRDSLRCTFDGDSIEKCCYEGTLQRTFISRVNKNGESTVEWFDRMIRTPEETEADEERGSVVFDGEMLSGVIK